MNYGKTMSHNCSITIRPSTYTPNDGDTGRSILRLKVEKASRTLTNNKLPGNDNIYGEVTRCYANNIIYNRVVKV